ncbi:EAL domain-containing protein [Geodermatophilus sp. YIM 151500]|uniref:putative bifunctional diguanylate cyclase/phosphodiesterase n=1 Tax=Geodermatophilus sp. YIM 151500 TaxID=2984531 RepID=UPI0021E46A93|nr:bifunctional diguanylate cyclase/phosphodiesterase [Geodermatophilus sp. YIM 151500]MCV2489420.1 EAL domain-containing protein [Geodermatophilus sp. YIM 151500]
MVTAATAEVPLDFRRVRVARETLVVQAFSALLLGGGLAVAWPLLDDGPYLPSPELPWWALAVAFAVAETAVVYRQVKREAKSITLSEVPLVIALYLASPVALLAGRAAGMAAISVLHRRTPALKTTFNVANVVGETGIAIAVFALLTPAAGGVAPMTWPGALAAAVIANAFGITTVNLVIAVYEGRPAWRALLRESVEGQPAAPLAVAVALVAVTGLSASPDTAWLFVALGATLLVGYKAYGALADRHMHLERLYRFSQRVSGAPGIDEVMAGVLAEAREMLRSERASAAFVGADGGIIARVRAVGTQVTRSEEPATDDDAWLLRQVVDGGGALLMPRHGRDAAARRWLDSYGMRDAVAVPLRSGDGVIGVLVVADRLGDVRTYEPGDVLLMETIANHASVALRNGELIEKLRHEALHDALTGLANRVQLQRRLAAALEDVSAGRSAGAAVMILDLDDFKEVNDTLGHQQGDAVLVEIGARLGGAVGQAGLVARLGGDEFAVLLPDGADEQRAQQVGRRVLRALEQPILLDGMEVEVGGSIGLALAPRHATDPAALLKRADMAMHDAKVSTRRLRLFESDLDTDNPRRLTLAAELRASLQNGDLTVHVQPQAQLAGGEVTAVEALVRWRHPELGDVPPDQFIPVAERSGLIGPLTTRVLDLALAASAGWSAVGHDVAVAVNLSPRSLHDADLVDEVERLLRRHGVPADRLTLEVTESAVMADPARAVGVLHQLRDLGVRLSVDDFGTGYSSLSYLKRLPVQEVKIDRSFITGLGTDGDDLPIVRAIVDMGRHMGLEVVAEGVEDQATEELLAAMGCDLVQGWHLGRPMPASELVPWLRTRVRTRRGRGPLRVV